MRKYFDVENSIRYKDGDEPATIDCPNCCRETYDLDENICVLCETSLERNCARCSSSIPSSELDETGFCGYCNYIMAKDD
jgi:hypothetical protein